jgi:stage V sporulation protein G
MEITEVRIKLMEDSDDRLRAFCSVTLDDSFVVRDLKIIDGVNGPFVAMPSRKLTSHCSKCGAKNHLRANYCNQCGERQFQERAARDQEGRVKLYADIAHPINSACREMIQQRVIAEYQGELERAKQPGYVSKYDDAYGEDEGEDYEVYDPAHSHAAPPVKTQIQPAQPTPPPPHQPPAQPTAPPAQRARRGNQFGAGIFEEQ